MNISYISKYKCKIEGHSKNVSIKLNIRDILVDDSRKDNQ